MRMGGLHLCGETLVEHGPCQARVALHAGTDEGTATLERKTGWMR